MGCRKTKTETAFSCPYLLPSAAILLFSVQCCTKFSCFSFYWEHSVTPNNGTFPLTSASEESSKTPFPAVWLHYDAHHHHDYVTHSSTWICNRSCLSILRENTYMSNTNAIIVCGEKCLNSAALSKFLVGSGDLWDLEVNFKEKLIC